MFIATLLKIFKICKQPKHPWKDDWIKKMCYTHTHTHTHTHTMEYYSAIKKNTVMPFATTWIQLEIIILSEVSRKEKDKYHMISLICGI